MKRFLILLTLMAFLIAGTVATYSFAQSAAKEQKVNCCLKGSCKQVAKSICVKAGGKVVKNCKDCKPAGMK
jgi:uncharacterized protein with ATP-grasp and redox domains